MARYPRLAFSVFPNFGLRARCDMFSGPLALSDVIGAGKADKYYSGCAEGPDS
jgi:hypothetical protein